jgi:hypothetical protein
LDGLKNEKTVVVCVFKGWMLAYLTPKFWSIFEDGLLNWEKKKVAWTLVLAPCFLFSLSLSWVLSIKFGRVRFTKKKKDAHPCK